MTDLQIELLFDLSKNYNLFMNVHSFITYIIIYVLAVWINKLRFVFVRAILN